MPDPVNVTIDDIKVQVPAGTLVIDAAKAAGIDIPIFCSHPKLDPLGACRMCLVEFPSPRGSRLDTACTVRVSEGMAVVTNSQAVREAREAVLGFILINHPLDCPICDKGGECPLQDNTMEYGPGASKFVEAKRHKQKHYPISDLIMLDQERCILCWRCIRYLEEWEDKPQIGLFERGGETVIDVFPGQPVDAKTSGSIIDICPVGALTNRVARFKYRPWELRKTPSICTHCPVGCNLRLDERVHTLRRIVARENMAVNDEWICDKGRFLHQHVDHPDRLKTPLIRENGALRPATWDEAIATIVDRLESIVEGPAHPEGRGDPGGRPASTLGGIAGGRVSNETAYLFQKFIRAFTGSNNIDFSEGSAVRAQPAGLSAIANIGRSDVIVLVDFDPSEAAPVLDLHIKRAIRRNGAKLIIINPRQIELTRYTTGDKGAYIPVRPGESATALDEIATQIQRKKEEEKRKKENRPSKEHLPSSPGGSAAAFLLPSALLASAKAPLFIYGPDAARGQTGRQTVAALSNLAAQLGRGEIAYIGHEPNGQGLRDMGLTSDSLPGQLPVADPAVRDRLGKLWGIQPPAQPGLSYTEMLEGGVKALYIIEADPGASPRIAAALSQLEFLVVQDLFLTETARLAHVVLPTTSWAESDGTYTNLERRVQAAPAGIDPIDSALPGWAILTRLAERWLAAPPPDSAATPTATADWKRKKRAQATRTGPTPKPWTYTSAQSVLEEITRAIPAYANLRWEALTSQGQQWTVTGTEGRRKKEEGRSDPATVETVQATSLQPGAFRLISGPVLWDGSPLMQHAAGEVRQKIPAPYIALNPADLSSFFLASEGSLPSSFSSNAQATVTSALATVTLQLRADPTVPTGAAWIPYGLPGHPAETLGAGRGEPVSVTIAPDHPSLE